MFTYIKILIMANKINTTISILPQIMFIYKTPYLFCFRISALVLYILTVLYIASIIHIIHKYSHHSPISVKFSRNVLIFSFTLAQIFYRLLRKLSLSLLIFHYFHKSFLKFKAYNSQYHNFSAKNFFEFSVF